MMELCEEGSLRKFMKENGAIPEKKALEIIFQIAQGLYVLHNRLKITHRDLKPDNILRSEGIYKIADFGLSTTKSYFTGNCGTPVYMAPELHKN